METGQNRLAGDFRGIQLAAYALPSILMMVFQGCYTLVDTMFVSQFVSTDALAAVNVVTPVINLTVGIGTMLAAGGNAVIAGNMGEGKAHLAKENFTLIVCSGMAAGILFAAAAAFRLEKILMFLGAEGRLSCYAEDYLGCLLYFLPAYMMQTIFANLFVTAGCPGLGSGLSIGAGALNIVLDYFFMVICQMGIKGAALGTGISVMVMAGSGLIFFGILNRNGTLCFVRPQLRMKVLIESCLNGSSEMAGQLAGAVTTLLFNLSMFRLAGEDGVAAITILNYAQFLFHTVYIGFSMGTAPIIGYNYGSGNLRRLKRIIRECIRLTAGASFGIFLLSYAGGYQIIRLFADREEAVYALASEGMRIFSAGFLFGGFNLFVSSMFTAVSNGKISALLAFLRTFVFLVAAILLLPCFLGITGVWLAVPAAEFLAALISAYFLRRFMKEIRQKEEQASSSGCMDFRSVKSTRLP